MAGAKSEVLLIGPSRPVVAKGFAALAVHSLSSAADRDALLASVAHVRAMAVSAPVEPINDALLARLPQLDPIPGYSERFGADRFGIAVECDEAESARIEALMREAGAEEVAHQDLRAPAVVAH